MAAALFGCASALPAGDHLAMAFEDLGCRGEWPTDTPQKTSVVRTETDLGTTFHVTHPATCGLRARKPGYTVRGTAVELRYELYSPTGSVVMCDCAYQSKFTFPVLPPSVQSASFTWSEHDR